MMLPLDDDGELPPPPPPTPAPPPPPPPPPPVDVPVEWLLSNATAPLQYRVIKTFLAPEAVPQLAESLTLNREAGRLVVHQSPEGSWNHAITHAPAPGARNPAAAVGSATAVHRLIELGWDRECPVLLNARRPLFRLLAEDLDPAYLYEMSGVGKDAESIAWGRGVVRGAAAAALAHAGYERDPRVRGAATRLLERVDEFISSPLADDPWVKVGGVHAISPEAFPPTLHFLVMLAFMPGFRNERDDFVDRLRDYLSRPLPKHEPAQVVGQKVMPNPYLVLGDPLGAKHGMEGDVPFALFWLEMMARLTVLQRAEGWLRQFERLLDDRDRDFVWHPGKAHGTVTANPVAWPFADLQGKGGAGLPAEATFRLGLVASLLGRPVEFA